MRADTIPGEQERPSLTSSPALAESHYSTQPNVGTPKECPSMKQKLLCLLVVFQADLQLGVFQCIGGL